MFPLHMRKVRHVSRTAIAFGGNECPLSWKTPQAR